MRCSSSASGNLLARAARRSPDRVALVAVEDDRPRRQWTYQELLADAELVAKALLARFEPGDHVAVWSANRYEWTLLEWGCALAGIVLVTVNPALRDREVAYVLKQSRARGIVTADAHRDNDMLGAIARVPPGPTRSARRHPPGRMGFVPRRRGRRGAARCRSTQSCPGAVHERHDRVPQGCAVAPHQHRQQRPFPGQPAWRHRGRCDPQLHAAVPHRRLCQWHPDPCGLRRDPGPHVDVHTCRRDPGGRARALHRHRRRDDDVHHDDGRSRLRRPRPVGDARRVDRRLDSPGHAGAADREQLRDRS